MSDHQDPDPDTQFFREQMANVTRNKNNQRHVTQQNTARPKPLARQREADELDIREELANIDWRDLDPETTGEALAWRGGGLPQSTWRQLQRGRYRIDARLDLHGLRREQAVREIKRFINDSHQQQLRCLLIIHGQGHNSAAGGVLKALTDSQLRNNRHVTAFCSAQPSDGGAGAVYALIRRG